MTPRIGMALGMGAVAIAALGLSAAVALRPAGPMARARSAEARGDWKTVASATAERRKLAPDDLEAQRLAARASARLGRPAEALRLYQSIGPEHRKAADFLAIGEILLGQGRDVLGWAALEAANRLDPADPAVRDARTSLRSRLGGQGEIVRVADRLAAVPGGPPLGELVLGLALESQTDSSDDPVFDGVAIRDRAFLAKRADPRAVSRFLARVLLEAGRPAQARERLLAILKDGTDPEASWLLSRASLQEGDDDRAASALAASKGFGAAHAHEAEPAAFVGARACRSCHSTIYDQEQSSRHATTLRLGPEMASVPLPEGVVTDPADPSVTHRFSRDGEKVRVETTANGETYRALLDYALGSGHRGVTMIGKDDHGTFRELRISHYSENGSVWDITSGFSEHPSDPREFLGKGMSESGFRDCIHCHATRFRTTKGRTGPEAADRGIGCERCHGPGGNHVLAMERGFGDPAIGRPKGANGPDRSASCAACHSSDGTFPPTDPQFIRFQSTTLPMSKCFTASGGKLDCVTCHDPHKKLETAASVYEKKCLECHAAGKSPERVACPVEPSRDCLRCHMPKVEEVVSHTSFTDHQIRVHPEGRR